MHWVPKSDEELGIVYVNKMSHTVTVITLVLLSV